MRRKNRPYTFISKISEALRRFLKGSLFGTFVAPVVIIVSCLVGDAVGIPLAALFQNSQYEPVTGAIPELLFNSALQTSFLRIGLVGGIGHTLMSLFD